MAMIKSSSGSKVGWETYDNEAEARQRADQVAEHRDSMLDRGYDFGYQWPGTVQKYNEEWIVTVP